MVGRILCNGLCNASVFLNPRRKAQLRPHLCRETGMSIAFESSEVELQKLRERLRLMSDEELVKFGKQVRSLSEPKSASLPTRGRRNCRKRVPSGGAGIRKRSD